MPLGSVVWPLCISVSRNPRVQNIRQEAEHALSSYNRPFPHLSLAYVAVFRSCRLDIMFNGLVVAIGM